MTLHPAPSQHFKQPSLPQRVWRQACPPGLPLGTFLYQQQSLFSALAPRVCFLASPFSLKISPLITFPQDQPRDLWPLNPVPTSTRSLLSRYFYQTPSGYHQQLCHLSSHLGEAVRKRPVHVTSEQARRGYKKATSHSSSLPNLLFAHNTDPLITSTTDYPNQGVQRATCGRVTASALQPQRQHCVTRRPGCHLTAGVDDSQQPQQPTLRSWLVVRFARWCP